MSAGESAAEKRADRQDVPAPTESEDAIDEIGAGEAVGRTFGPGLGLGVREAHALMSEVYCQVIGVVGLPDSGKTSFLMALYSMCLNSMLAPEFRFAGSRCLPGFEQLMGGIRVWQKGQLSPRLVPHTTAGGGREPSLLHLLLRDDARNRKLHLLFTDLPGEWFEKLINRPDSVADSLAFLRRCDGALLLSEAPALHAPDTGHIALSSLRQLTRRLVENHGLGITDRGKVVVLITKSDAVPPEVHPDLVRSVEGEIKPFMPKSQVLICAALSHHPAVLPVCTGVKDALLYVTAPGERTDTMPMPAGGSTLRTLWGITVETDQWNDQF